MFMTKDAKKSVQNKPREVTEKQRDLWDDCRRASQPARPQEEISSFFSKQGTVVGVSQG